MKELAEICAVSGLRWEHRLLKRCFDVGFAGLVITLLSPAIIVAVVAATVDTGAWGVFSQDRVGHHGRRFRIYKIRTMRPAEPGATTVTTSRDPRITPLGRWMRGMKIDELPQFINVLLGHMSVVGPRPDVPGFADTLEGEERIVLCVRPGVTGPASVYFRDEELLLSAQGDPERYNREVLWPAKVRINVAYVRNYSFIEDLRLICDTALSSRASSRAARARRGLIDAEEFQRA